MVTGEWRKQQLGERHAQAHHRFQGVMRTSWFDYNKGMVRPEA